MKRIVATLLLLSLTISLFSCNKTNPKEISCEDIIFAYKNSGYRLSYHNHDDPIYYEYNELCHMEIEDPSNPEKNYIYITRYFTADDANAMKKERQFNVILWLFFGVFGEWRWLKSGVYGDIYYETFDSKMISPLNKLIESSQ